jgi:hypothetical protein
MKNLYKKTLAIFFASMFVIVMSGCDDEEKSSNDTHSEESSENYKIKGDVLGCVIDANGDPVSGAIATIGNISAKTDSDGCYSLGITLETMRSNSVTLPEFNQQIVHVEHEKFLDTFKFFKPTTNVVAGVIFDFGTYPLATDGTPPKDNGIVGNKFAKNMLIEGIDGKTNPFEVELSEYIELESSIKDDIFLSIKDINGTEIDSSLIDIDVTFDNAKNIISFKTSKAIDEGLFVTIRVPTRDMKDVNGNNIVSGKDATVLPFGDSFSDYWTFNVRIFTQGDMNAQTVLEYSQMDNDSLVENNGTYAQDIQVLEDMNDAYKNVLKYANNSGNSKTISMFNSGGALTASRMKALADAYVTDPTQSITNVINDVVRIKFKPTNAQNYSIKAYDENNLTINFTQLDEVVNATAKISNGNVDIENITDLSKDVELVLRGLDGDDNTQIVIVPLSTAGIAGEASVLVVKDNVNPTTSLQYSYDNSDDTSSEVVVSGGVVLSNIYGGSGETSNGEYEKTDLKTNYNIGSPYLNMTSRLLIDQNKTNQNSGLNILASTYTQDDYSAWTQSENTSRSIGIGFTEAINVNSNAVLKDSNLQTVSGLITNTVNTTDNIPVVSQYTGKTEDIAIVTVSNIFTLVNEHNGSIIDLSNRVKDLSGNIATNAKVILIDKVPPFIVSSDIDISDMKNSIITFSENIKSGNIDINGTICNIDDGNITNNIAKLDGCSYSSTGVAEIGFNNISDLNGNRNNSYKFKANIK